MRTNKQLRARIVRWTVLGLSSVFFLFFSTVISEHAICPIGGFELFFTSLFGTGLTIAGLLSGMTIIFIIMSVFSIVFRRAYCGYICPMGAMQELMENAGKKLLPGRLRNLRIPRKIDRILRWVKYPVLASFIVGAAITGTHWMIPGDPFIVMMNLFVKGGVAAAWARFPFAVLFFFGILGFAFFIGRGFCKYICPAGAWYAILSKASPSRIVRNESACTGCSLCTKACPMNIDVASVKSVSSVECLGCQECVNACPSAGALSYKTAKATIPAMLLPVASVAIFAGSVALAKSITPARGERPQGGQRPDSREGGSYSGTREGSSSVNGKKVSFGGCPNCSGCGICEVV